jgi:hypothetical protein
VVRVSLLCLQAYFIALNQLKFSPPKQLMRIETIVVRTKLINADSGAIIINITIAKMSME